MLREKQNKFHSHLIFYKAFHCVPFSASSVCVCVFVVVVCVVCCVNWCVCVFLLFPAFKNPKPSCVFLLPHLNDKIFLQSFRSLFKPSVSPVPRFCPFLSPCLPFFFLPFQFSPPPHPHTHPSYMDCSTLGNSRRKKRQQIKMTKLLVGLWGNSPDFTGDTVNREKTNFRAFAVCDKP